jgi:hypothetical protein
MITDFKLHNYPFKRLLLDIEARSLATEESGYFRIQFKSVALAGDADKANILDIMSENSISELQSSICIALQKKWLRETDWGNLLL